MAENVAVQLYKKNFSTSLYSADTKCQSSYRYFKKRRGTNKFVCTIQEVNFPKHLSV